MSTATHTTTDTVDDIDTMPTVGSGSNDHHRRLADQTIHASLLIAATILTITVAIPHFQQMCNHINTLPATTEANRLHAATILLERTGWFVAGGAMIVAPGFGCWMVDRMYRMIATTRPVTH